MAAMRTCIVAIACSITYGASSASDKIMNTTLPMLLGQLAEKTGYHFSLEELNTASTEGGVKRVKERALAGPKMFSEVQQDELDVRTAEAISSLIIKHFPGYTVKKAKNAKLKTLHIIDQRLSKIKEYPLDGHLDEFAFIGTPDKLIDKLSTKNPDISRSTSFVIGDPLAGFDESTHLEFSASNITIREALTIPVADTSYRGVIWHARFTQGVRPACRISYGGLRPPAVTE